MLMSESATAAATTVVRSANGTMSACMSETFYTTPALLSLLAATYDKRQDQANMSGVKVWDFHWKFCACSILRRMLSL